MTSETGLIIRKIQVRIDDEIIEVENALRNENVNAINYSPRVDKLQSEIQTFKKVLDIINHLVEQLAAHEKAEKEMKLDDSNQNI